VPISFNIDWIMLVSRLFPLGLVLAISLFFAACQEDTTDKNKAYLSGRWELYKGLRNKKPTETLAGIYFEFNSNGMMKTNLPVGPEGQVPFELSKNTILQKSNKPVQYEIRQICDTTMLLTLETRGMPFELYLRKAQERKDTLPSAVPVLPASDTTVLR
jgi:hypothetical protein